MNNLSIFSNKKKFLILIPILVVILSMFLGSHIVQEIQNELMVEQMEHLSQSLTRVAGAYDLEELSPEDRVAVMSYSIEYLDRLRKVYAGLYEWKNDDFVLMSERFCDTTPPFDPFIYDEFWDNVFETDCGEFTVFFKTQDDSDRWQTVHFHWVRDDNHEYLLMVGASPLSVTATIAEWVTLSFIGFVAMTFILNIWLVIKLTQVGFVWDVRKKPGYRDKE